MPVPESRYAYPQLERISDYVTYHAERSPDALAVVSEDKRLTYADLASAVEQFSKALIAVGVGKGERVATLSPPGADFIISFLATASIGAIWVGLNPKYKLEELTYVVSDAKPSALLTRAQVGGREYSSEIAKMQAADETLHTTVCLDEVPHTLSHSAHSLAGFLKLGASSDAGKVATARRSAGGRQACMIVYTSGSTGKPKGALLHHEGIIRFSRLQNRYWPMTPLRMLNYLPINHVGCVVDISTPCLVHGGTIVFAEEFSPEAALILTESEQVTALASVPSALQMMLEAEALSQFDPSHLQMAIWEGGPMSRDWIRRLHAVCPRLATNYGMTETTSAVTIVEPTDDFELLESSVGYPIEGSEVRITDPETGERLPQGKAGEIQVRSPNNMLGYWNRPEATAETILPDGFLRTGDIGYFRPDGALCLSGRLKEMFKSGGYNVYPIEIEAVLEAHPSVLAAAVVAAPDPLWTEVGYAFVTASEPIDLADLQEWCRERLANYKVPKRFERVDRLPLLPIGKIDRVALRRRAETAVSDNTRTA